MSDRLSSASSDSHPINDPSCDKSQTRWLHQVSPESLDLTTSHNHLVTKKSARYMKGHHVNPTPPL